MSDVNRTINREQVIAALKVCPMTELYEDIKPFRSVWCGDCPYSRCNNGPGCQQLFRDVISLLKDYKPVVIGGRLHCGHCNSRLKDIITDYCPACGVGILWDSDKKKKAYYEYVRLRIYGLKNTEIYLDQLYANELVNDSNGNE